jgi:predicted ATP-dependent serine protease
MAHIRNIYICSSCGETSPKWVGKCLSCSAWNSFVEDAVDSKTFKAIIQLLRKINNTGTTVLLTTHNQEIIDYFENHQKRMMNLRNGVMYEHMGKLSN